MTTVPHAVAVRSRSDATSVPAVIWLEAPLSSTSEMVATTWASVLVEPSQMVASIGPEIAYGAVNGGVVKVAERSSLGWLSFSQVATPATSPAVHCVVEREQMPFTGIQGSATVVSPSSAAGASEPAKSEVPLPLAADRYQVCGRVREAGYRLSATHRPAPR